MKYRTLILTVFMTIGCMSNAAEHRPQATSGNSFLNASIWGLGGLTAFLGLKAGYHFVQACRYNNNQLRDAKAAHNKAVMDAGRSKLEGISQILSSSPHVIPDIQNIIHGYSSVSGEEYVTENKELLIADTFGLFLNKLNTAGAFASLSDDEKDQLRTRKQQIQEEEVKNQPNTRKFMQHTQQQYLTTALFFVSGSALMAAYVFKNRSSQK